MSKKKNVTETLVQVIEENQTRKILLQIESCETLQEAIEEVRKLLEEEIASK